MNIFMGEDKSQQSRSLVQRFLANAKLEKLATFCARLKSLFATSCPEGLNVQQFSETFMQFLVDL